MTALIAWNITPTGLPRVSHAISSAFMVSLLSGENDMAQPTGFLAGLKVTLEYWSYNLSAHNKDYVKY